MPNYVRSPIGAALGDAGDKMMQFLLQKMEDRKQLQEKEKDRLARAKEFAEQMAAEKERIAIEREGQKAAQARFESEESRAVGKEMLDRATPGFQDPAFAEKINKVFPGLMKRQGPMGSMSTLEGNVSDYLQETPQQERERTGAEMARKVSESSLSTADLERKRISQEMSGYETPSARRAAEQSDALARIKAQGAQTIAAAKAQRDMMGKPTFEDLFRGHVQMIDTAIRNNQLDDPEVQAELKVIEDMAASFYPEQGKMFQQAKAMADLAVKNAKLPKPVTGLRILDGVNTPAGQGADKGIVPGSDLTEGSANDIMNLPDESPSPDDLKRNPLAGMGMGLPKGAMPPGGPTGPTPGIGPTTPSHWLRSIKGPTGPGSPSSLPLLGRTPHSGGITMDDLKKLIEKALQTGDDSEIRALLSPAANSR